MSEKTKISQSLIKAFRGDYCPLKNKVVYITREYVQVPSSSMEKGIYFETLAIGSGARGTQIYDLPRLKNGKKSADQMRIEDQAINFANVMINHDIYISRSQEYLSHELENNLIIEGTLDIIGSIFDDLTGTKDNNAIIDIKLTQSIYSQFGDYCWHFPHNMDHTQAFMYSVLYEANYGVLPNFYYLVFDYKPKPEYKIIRKIMTTMDRNELIESIRSTVEKIELHERKGYWTNPSYENCKNCPIQHLCSDFSKRKKIEIV